MPLKNLTLLTILLLCGTSVSCIRRETSIPQINGTVSDGNLRLSGARVSFQVHGYSKDRTERTVVESAITTTNHEGAFSISRTTKLGFFLPVPADYAIPVSLCFKSESAPRVAGRWNSSAHLHYQRN
jgi:hypothetical protein